MPSLISTIDSRGKKTVIQNVYIGSIDRLVTQAQLQAIFSQCRRLKNLHLPLDSSTGLHHGYAFLSYSDAKSANSVIKTMAGQSIAGRQL
jgi:RNA recognition motif-containing protein